MRVEDGYCIVGVSETTYYKSSGRTTLSLAAEAIRNAVEDAGLPMSEVDGLTDYQWQSDAVSVQNVASATGIRPSYGASMIGGGGCTEALIAHAVGLIKAGYCRNMVIYRTLNGRSGMRFGGHDRDGPASRAEVRSISDLHTAFGCSAYAQQTALTCQRYMHDYGITEEHLAEVALAHRAHANLNPKAIMYDRPMTRADYLASRWICKPFRLFDICLETDCATAMVITSVKDARELKQPPVHILGGDILTMSPDPAWAWGQEKIHRIGGFYGRNLLWKMSGIRPYEVDLLAAYDSFTAIPLLMLESYGFCNEGEAGAFIEGGQLRYDGDLPSNLSGGHLSEGYTNGMNLIIENVRQLRHRTDDACDGWREGSHSYDRSRGCRQLKKADIAVCMGWWGETTSSAMVLSN